MTATSFPDALSAGGRENATSARPPDLENGAHSLVTNSIFITLPPQSCGKPAGFLLCQRQTSSHIS